MSMPSPLDGSRPELAPWFDELLPRFAPVEVWFNDGGLNLMLSDDEGTAIRLGWPEAGHEHWPIRSRAFWAAFQGGGPAGLERCKAVVEVLLTRPRAIRRLVALASGRYRRVASKELLKSIIACVTEELDQVVLPREWYEEQALLHLAQGRFIPFLRVCEEHPPASPSGRVLHAVVAGRHLEAREGIEAHPRDGVAPTPEMYGSLQARRGLRETAEENLETNAAADDTLARRLRWWASRLPQGLPDFEWLAALAERTGPLSLLALSDVAMAHGEQGLGARLIEEVMPPEAPVTRVARARLALWRGELEEAGERAAPHLDDGQWSGVAHRVRGAALLLGGQPGLAAQHLQRACELAPDDSINARWAREYAFRTGEQLLAGYEPGSSRDFIVDLVYDALELTEFSEPDELVPPEALDGLIHEVILPVVGGAVHTPQDVIDVLWAFLELLGGNRSEALTTPSPDSAGGLAPLEIPGSSRDASVRLVWDFGWRPYEELDAEFAALEARYDHSPHPFTYRAETMLWLGRYEEALALFDRCLEERRLARWALVGKGAVLSVLGRDVESFEHYDRTDEVFGRLPSATTMVYRGELSRRRGRLEEAREDLEAAVGAKPGRAAAWLNLSLVHRALGDAEAATEAARRAAALIPGALWDAAEELGEELRLEGGVSEALADHVLAMMRGNRSSHHYTWFTADGELRHQVPLTEAVTWAREHLGQIVDRLVEALVMAQVTGDRT